MNSAFFYNSPIGEIFIEAEGDAVTRLEFSKECGSNAPSAPEGVIAVCVSQLDEYFAGTRHTFSLKINPKGTEFRKKVWAELLKIPYAETSSYKALALAAGNEKACRAVGGANHHNPVSIIIPCHRVIGSDGSLTGYGGELWRKEWLLNHEKRFSR